MSLLLVFLDGVGVGANDPATNPFLHARADTLRELFGAIPTLNNGVYSSSRARLVPTDALLGMPGLPQSGTGQTTIFTGINASAAIGHHYGPYPNDELRAILKRDNVFKQLAARGKRIAFANAYPPIFFERLAIHKARRTATMQAALAGGARFRDVNDLQAGTAVSGFSITNAEWVKRGARLPIITRRQAGRILMHIARENDFTAFEYALTDIAGHKGDRDWIVDTIEEVDELLAGILDELDDQVTVLFTSDHGNIEDWTAKGHTLNPSLTIVLGPGRDQIAENISSLTDITPTVIDSVMALDSRRTTPR